MAKLKELGEFVRSASSTIEAPVVRKLRDALPAAGAAAARQGPRQEVRRARRRQPSPPPRRAGQPRRRPPPRRRAGCRGSPAAPHAAGPRGSGPRATCRAGRTGHPGRAGAPPRHGSAARAPPSAPRRRPVPARRRAPAGPRPGNNPFTSAAAPAWAARPRRGRATTRYSTGGATGMPRPGGVPARRRAPGPPAGPPRPGGPRPNPGMMPRAPGARRRSPAGPAVPVGRGAPAGRPGGPAALVPAAAAVAGGSRWRRRCRSAAALPAAVGPGAGRPGGGGRGGGPRRGGTAGAFGRPGGPPRRGRKSKKQRRQEFDNMQAPSIGGVQVPRGDGSTVVRLPRGSSLTDFADKIDANPASLVTVLFHLGEMATATQSLDEETFALLGAELGYEVQIVSPEDEDRELLESFDIDFDERRRRRRGPGRAAAGRHRHGSRRPRKDPPARRDPADRRRRGRGRWHHPAHRCLPGARSERPGASPSSTPRVTRRSPPCVPVVPRSPTSRCSWSRPTTASCRRRSRRSTTRRRPTCRSWWRSTRSTRKAPTPTRSSSS